MQALAASCEQVFAMTGKEALGMEVGLVKWNGPFYTALCHDRAR